MRGMPPIGQLIFSCLINSLEWFYCTKVAATGQNPKSAHGDREPALSGAPRFATKCPSRLQSKPSASGRKRPPISFILPPTLLRLFGRLLAGFRRWALFPRWRRSRRRSGPLLRWRLNTLRRRLHLPRLRRRLHLPWLWRRLHLVLRLRRWRWLKATLLRRRLRCRERRRLGRDWPHDRWLLLRRTVRRSLGPAQLRLRWRWRD